MEISPNLNFNSVDGTASQKQPKAAPANDADGDQDRVTLTDMTSIHSALDNTPASRPDAVARARQLINDPNYPSPAVTSQVSKLLADKMLSQND
jgi:hypothetical protein